MVKLHLVGIISLFALGACTVPGMETTKKLATDLKDNIYTTTARVKEWALTPPQQKGEPLPVPDTYCYRAQTDILCYHQPMAGWEGRLVAYQGTVAAPPAPAKMELLAKQQEVDVATLPATKAANAKPVFTSLPAFNKDKEKSDQPQVMDSSHELLPDPSLTPQL